MRAIIPSRTPRQDKVVHVLALTMLALMMFVSPMMLAMIGWNYDAVGGSATDRLAQCLSEGGTLVNYGMMSGEPCTVAPSSLIFRGITLRGFWLVKWFREASRDAQRALYGELAQMVASGVLHARVHATYPVQKIREAVAAANGGERDGKILVTGSAT